MLVHSSLNVGDARSPQDIKRLRRFQIENARRMGEPCVYLHRFTLEELAKGTAVIRGLDKQNDLVIRLQRCPACQIDTYRGARADCPVCFGTTVTSVETESGLYINTKGRLTNSSIGNVAAPLYRGFGPPVLVWTIQPDVATDTFRLDNAGVMQRIESPRVYAPWQPDMADTDVLVNVVLHDDQRTVAEVGDRYEIQEVNPMTIRGYGRIAQNREFKVGQQFEMNRLPFNHPYYGIQIPSSVTDWDNVRLSLTVSGVVS